MTEAGQNHPVVKTKCSQKSSKISDQDDKNLFDMNFLPYNIEGKITEC